MYQSNRSTAEKTVGTVKGRSLTQELGGRGTQHDITFLFVKEKKRRKEADFTKSKYKLSPLG
jgi:hypothetical protein